MERPVMSEPPFSYKIAVVKFNGGRGALLCNGCQTILATGFSHADKAHYCTTCAAKPHLCAVN
jgi:hypothetical protein